MDAKYCVTSVLFRFSRNITKHVQNYKFHFVGIHFEDRCSYRLNYLPGSSHAKFVESHEHPKALIVLYGLAYFFYKSRSLKRGVRTVQTIPYKLKFDTKIGMYPAMSFVVMCFKEGILQSRFWDCVRPYDRSFSKIGEIEIWQISDPKGVNVFQNKPFKMEWRKGAKWSGCLYLKLNRNVRCNSKLIKSMLPKL